jgi:hypothetical protein
MRRKQDSLPKPREVYTGTTALESHLARSAKRVYIYYTPVHLSIRNVDRDKKVYRDIHGNISAR